ncbi:MAG: uracil-DNA glycosylase family protein [Pseudomonadota bacterium]
MSLAEEIKSCRFCAPAFAATKTAHVPRPVVWFQPEARILIAGQAPGLRVHKSGRPFTDPSGERLRRWMGIDEETFYDRARIAIVPMAFCFPGYSAKGADLPPPKGCAQKWRARVMAGLGNVETTLLVGGPAQSWHIGPGSVTARVAAWRDFAPRVFPLPHPSWRNNHWLAKHPWFEADLIPALQARMKDML